MARFAGLTIRIVCGKIRFMSTLGKADILSLSVAERIQLVEDIWDSIVESPQEVTLTEELKAELDRRLDEYRENPDGGSPWELVKERIRSRI
jgi:putative addiction module component (TIGR02574 family)